MFGDEKVWLAMEMVLRSDTGYFSFSGIKTKTESHAYLKRDDAFVEVTTVIQRQCTWIDRAKERQSEAAAWFQGQG